MTRDTSPMANLLSYSQRLSLSGQDTISLLDRIVTCSVGDLPVGTTRPGALLTPQGKVIADFLLAREDDHFFLDVHPDAAADLEKKLKLFRLRADVAITSEAIATPRVEPAERIAAGQPMFGLDFRENEVFPTDINLDLFGGIAYQKGCFVGQEVVSRMYRRGKIRRRTIVIEGEGLETGTEIRADDKLIGQITSASEKLALARVRLDHLFGTWAANTPLTVGTQAVTVKASDWLIEQYETEYNSHD